MNLSINLLCLMAKSMNMISEERPVLCLIRYEEVFKEEMNTNYALIDFKITSAKAHQNQFASQNHPEKDPSRAPVFQDWIWYFQFSYICI